MQEPLQESELPEHQCRIQFVFIPGGNENNNGISFDQSILEKITGFFDPPIFAIGFVVFEKCPVIEQYLIQIEKDDTVFSLQDYSFSNETMLSTSMMGKIGTSPIMSLDDIIPPIFCKIPLCYSRYSLNLQ